jgi:hypothetical protein
LQKERVTGPQEPAVQGQRRETVFRQVTLFELSGRRPDPPVKDPLYFEHLGYHADAEKDHVSDQNDQAYGGPVLSKKSLRLRLSTFRLFQPILLEQ